MAKKVNREAAVAIEQELEAALDDAMGGVREAVRGALRAYKDVWVEALIGSVGPIGALATKRVKRITVNGAATPKAKQGRQVMPVADRIMRVLRETARSEGLRSAIVVNRVAASEQAVYHTLNKLVEQGLVERKGKRPNTTWRAK